MAVRIKKKEVLGTDPATGASLTATHTALGQILAVGRAALEYKSAPDVAVFSSFRHGQIAHYSAAEYFFKALLKQFLPKAALFKPVLCIHVQPQTTEVEERAIIDAGIQAGARKIFLYQESLSFLLDHFHTFGVPKDAIIIHIDPQE